MILGGISIGSPHWLSSAAVGLSKMLITVFPSLRGRLIMVVIIDGGLAP